MLINTIPNFMQQKVSDDERVGKYRRKRAKGTCFTEEKMKKH